MARKSESFCHRGDQDKDVAIYRNRQHQSRSQGHERDFDRSQRARNCSQSRQSRKSKRKQPCSQSQDRCSMKMIISCFIVIAIQPSLGINSSEDLQWITKPRTIHACNGQTLDLNWEFDVKGKEIRTLEWYFNDILICIVSDNDEFKVNIPYQDKIERSGKSGIRLKNISLDDEGTFTLFPVFYWSTSESMQSISLQVAEPPTDMCMVKISFLGNPSNLVCDVSSSDCGKPQMSAVWKRSKTFEVLAEGNYIEINSSFYDSEILCCPHGKAMDCVDDSSHRFCTSVPLSANESPSKPGNNMLKEEPATTQVPQSSDTDWSKLHDLIIIILLIGVIVISMATIFYFINCRQMMKLVAEMQEMRKDKNAGQKEETTHLLEEKEGEDSTAIKLCRETIQLLEWKEAADSTLVTFDDTEDETNKANTEHEPVPIQKL